MITFDKLRKCWNNAKQYENSGKRFTREEFIATIGCAPEELEAVCFIKRLPQSHTIEEELTNEYVEELINTCNPNEETVSYHDGKFYRKITECVRTFMIVECAGE